jgi:hypothetical protein
MYRVLDLGVDYRREASNLFLVLHRQPRKLCTVGMMSPAICRQATSTAVPFQIDDRGNQSCFLSHYSVALQAKLALVATS